jgi:peptide chain release factor 2
MTCEVVFDLEAKKKEIDELNQKISQVDFWADNTQAQSTLKHRATLLDTIEHWEKLATQLEECQVMIELAQEEEDLSLIPELQEKIDTLEKKIEEMELETLLPEREASNNAILAIHPGAGGTESQDWAEILYYMYLKWAEKRGFQTEIIDWQNADEAGIKNVTFSITGRYAYGYLKGEIGVHRLVRISPFDYNRRRHTSFASVFVYPEMDEEIKIEMDEADLRIDTYRSRGAGGQHVNVTDSAVRITHLPSGIVVQCQNERSQHKNKAMAMKVLRARLYELELHKQAEQIEEMHKSKKEIAWGNQIRSYILYPYRLVKDHRTGLEKGDVDAVLNGEIDDFIEAYLKKKYNR